MVGPAALVANGVDNTKTEMLNADVAARTSDLGNFLL
jgi:hypothetical protein